MKPKLQELEEFLFSNGWITREQKRLLARFRKEKPEETALQAVTELGCLPTGEILEALSQWSGTPLIVLEDYGFNREAASKIPGNLAEKYNAVPVEIQNGRLLTAVSDPMDIYAIEDLEEASGMALDVVLADQEAIKERIERIYGRETADSAAEDVNTAYQILTEDGQNLSNDRLEREPVVKMINTLIRQAYAQNASDIHIEPSEKNLLVRFRINGDLVLYLKMTMAVHSAVLTRLKIMGGMNIAEKRLPQDGKYRFLREDMTVDLRISTLPTIYGEKAAIRLLDNGKRMCFSGMDQLGMSSLQAEQYEKILKTPNGIVLVSGPTGSGKTTTLYATLNKIVKKSINVITVEDPVEKTIEGASQVQVNQKAGLTFASALRSILRQDPDVIMIGEIRDTETAAIGVRAAITGHLVLSTIHTGDCASSITRLIDMGVEPYMAAAALSGIVAQRLVKLLCPHCRQAYKPDRRERALFPGSFADKMYRPVGCARCSGTGYLGRTAIYEVMEIDGLLSEMISKKASVYQIRQYAGEQGMISLKDRISRMVLEGRTSVEEMEKIIYSVE